MHDQFSFSANSKPTLLQRILNKNLFSLDKGVLKKKTVKNYEQMHKKVEKKAKMMAMVKNDTNLIIFNLVFKFG